jgi:hypothetical protein
MISSVNSINFAVVRRVVLAVALALLDFPRGAFSSNENPYSVFQTAPLVSDSLQINLGYATYEGFRNESTGLNTWLRSVSPPSIHETGCC